MSDPSLRFMDVAVSIGRHLCQTAYQDGGRCNWIGAFLEVSEPSGAASLVHHSLDPDLYSGTGGVALFLAELYAHTGDDALRQCAEGAISHALAHLQAIPDLYRLAFYSGQVGVAWSAARLGLLWGREELVASASGILARIPVNLGDQHLLDIVNGSAGAILALLALADPLGQQELVGVAVRLGEELLAAAVREDPGWSWGSEAVGFETRRNLTGFGHGAAGLGASLLELYRVTGREDFLGAAREAFRYENRWFRPAEENWPDFRFLDQEGVTEDTAPCALAWCHGAPGIGISRLRALQIAPTQQARRDAHAALSAVKRDLDAMAMVQETDYCLCHGLAGIADYLLYACQVLRDEEAGRLLMEIATQGAERHLHAPESWPCGVQDGVNPSLMLGLAGIGYFYLRLHDPTVPSLLLPCADLPAAESAPP